MASPGAEGYHFKKASLYAKPLILTGVPSAESKIQYKKYSRISEEYKSKDSKVKKVYASIFFLTDSMKSKEVRRYLLLTVCFWNRLTDPRKKVLKIILCINQFLASGFLRRQICTNLNPKKV